jgi:hypothetical protein
MEAVSPAGEHGLFFYPFDLLVARWSYVLRSQSASQATHRHCQRQGVIIMQDRRSQRIRQQLRQHPNPRSRSTDTLSFSEQIRRAYLPPYPAHSATPDLHTQLARQLETQRKGRR